MGKCSSKEPSGKVGIGIEFFEQQHVNVPLRERFYLANIFQAQDIPPESLK
jgi:hypothetical protein